MWMFSFPLLVLFPWSDHSKAPRLVLHRFIISQPNGSGEREVLQSGSIPVAILPSCQDMKTIVL